MKEKKVKDMLMDYVDELNEKEGIEGVILSLTYKREGEDDEPKMAFGSDTDPFHLRGASEILLEALGYEDEPIKDSNSEEEKNYIG